MPRKQRRSQTQDQDQTQNQSQNQNQAHNQTQNQSQNQNQYADLHLTDNDKLELELIEIGIAATYVDLLSSSLGLIAARQAEQLIIQRAMQPEQQNQQQMQNSNENQSQGQQNTNSNQNQGQQQETMHPTPGELATFASCLGVFTILIYTRISFIRLNQIYNQIQRGETNFTLTPSMNITRGFLCSCVGSLLRTIGAIQKVNEEAEIVFIF